jgi:hypothetical protein
MFGELVEHDLRGGLELVSDVDALGSGHGFGY